MGGGEKKRPVTPGRKQHQDARRNGGKPTKRELTNWSRMLSSKLSTFADSQIGRHVIDHLSKAGLDAALGHIGSLATQGMLSPSQGALASKFARNLWTAAGQQLKSYLTSDPGSAGADRQRRRVVVDQAQNQARATGGRVTVGRGGSLNTDQFYNQDQYNEHAYNISNWPEPMGNGLLTRQQQLSESAANQPTVGVVGATPSSRPNTSRSQIPKTKVASSAAQVDGAIKRKSYGRMTAAPVALSTHQGGREPHIINFDNDLGHGIKITHQEYLTPLSPLDATAIGTDLFLNRYPVNPTNADLFPWLSNMVLGRWDRFRFDRLKVTFVSQVGTSTDGTVILAFDPDASDYNESLTVGTTTLSLREIMAYRHSVMDRAWTNNELVIPRSSLNALTGGDGTLFCSRPIFTGEDRVGFTVPMNEDPGSFEHTTSAGALFMGATGLSPAVAPGLIMLEYSIELYAPELDASQVMSAGKLSERISGTGLSSTQPFGDGTSDRQTFGSMDVAWIFNANTVLLRRMGRFKVTITSTGTGFVNGTSLMAISPSTDMTVVSGSQSTRWSGTVVTTTTFLIDVGAATQWFTVSYSAGAPASVATTGIDVVEWPRFFPESGW